MPNRSLQRRKTPSKTPSADAPIRVWISGDFRAVELTRRLSRGGLQLKTDEQGNILLVHADRNDPPTMEARAQLFEARAIIEAARLAMASKLESRDPETTIANALQAAARMIDGVASDLGGAS